METPTLQVMEQIAKQKIGESRDMMVEQDEREHHFLQKIGESRDMMVERDEREHHFLHKRLYDKLRFMQSNQVSIVTIQQSENMEESLGRAAFRAYMTETQKEAEQDCD
jgi:hypothetical protein